MIELRPTRIIMISFYCFLAGLFLFSMTVNALFNNNGVSDMALWLPVGAAIFLAFTLAVVGVGILYYNQLCWKILFFFLIIFIANVFSVVLVVLFSLFFNVALLDQFYQGIHITPVAWFAFLVVFLLGILILYHLTRKEVVAFFGEMGDLIEPF